MKKERKKKILQGKYKFIIGLILGIVIASGGVYATTSISGSSITYSNKTSGLSSTNVQGAIDELYDKAKGSSFIEGYSDDENFIMGRETECYKTPRLPCSAGTIIRYKVSDDKILNFRVLVDLGDRLIMQSTDDILTRQKWKDSFSALAEETAKWNVNDITYTNPSSNKQVIAKARMITKEEAESLGCTSENDSCPVWLKDNGNEGYWTMEPFTDHSWMAYVIGGLNNNRVFQANHYEIYNHEYSSVRAVVEISKQ